MREFVNKLLDEENRTADLAAFGQLVALFVAVIMSAALIGASIWSTYKTGKIDSNALLLVSGWLGAALGYGVSDKFKAGGKKSPPAPPKKQGDKK